MSNRISDADLWNFLRACDDDATLAVLHEFGSLMIAEVQARTMAIDAKATNMVGWNAAVAGVLLLVLPRLGANSSTRWMVVGGALVSLAGTILAFLALRVRGFHVPSQLDWFNLERCESATKVRREHLLGMRRWHEQDSEVNNEKAAWMKWSQACLLCGALLVPFVLISSAFGFL